jgi:hypothetical protein
MARTNQEAYGLTGAVGAFPARASVKAESRANPGLGKTERLSWSRLCDSATQVSGAHMA